KIPLMELYFFCLFNHFSIPVRVVPFIRIIASFIIGNAVAFHFNNGVIFQRLHLYVIHLKQLNCIPPAFWYDIVMKYGILFYGFVLLVVGYIFFKRLIPVVKQPVLARNITWLITAFIA